MVDLLIAIRHHSPGEITNPEQFTIGNVHVNQGFSKTVIKGSFHKLVCGHNAITLGYPDLQAAIHRITETLGPKILEAQIVVLEIGVVVPTSTSPSTYLPLLIKANRHKRFEFGETTVSFGNKRSKILFYDKNAEQNTKSDSHLLRIELQVKRAVRKWFGRVLVLDDLQNPEVIKVFVQKFLATYDSVKKPTSVLKGVGPTTTPREAFWALLVDFLGEDGLQALLMRLRGYQSLMGKKYFDRLSTMIIENLCQQPTQIIELKNELDGKVNEQCSEILFSCLPNREVLL